MNSPRRAHRSSRSKRSPRRSNQKPQAFPRIHQAVTITPEMATELLKFYLRGGNSMARAGTALRLFQPPESPPQQSRLFDGSPAPQAPPQSPMARSTNPYSHPSTFAFASASLASAAQLTVSDLYLKHVEPYLRTCNRAKGTFDEYSTKLKQWREFWTSFELSQTEKPSVQQTEGYSEPPAATITSAVMLAFRQWLKQPPRALTNKTVNNALKCIRSILSIAAAKLEIPVPVPRIDKLPIPKASKAALPADQIGAIYEAASVAAWPAKHSPDVPASLQWRAAIVLYWFYGFRVQELISWEAEHEPLRWRNICWDPECPKEDSSATNQSGWLWYIPTKTRRTKPDPLFLPLPSVVAAHLRAIEPFNGAAPDSPIFPWPKSHQKIHKTWASIVAASQVRLKRRFDGTERKLHLQHFRKICSTAHELNERYSSPLVLGHAARGDGAVTHRHYISTEELLVPAFAKLQYPPAFDAVFDRPGKQLKLF